MTGNVDNARLALSGDLPPFSNMGSSRVVYLIDGVIYKVERHDCEGENFLEFENHSRLSGMLPSGFYLPEVYLYSFTHGDVLAMEYIKGSPTGECIDRFLGLPCEHTADAMCLPDHVVSELDRAGWEDPCFGNAIRTDNGIYLVDIA